MTKRKNRHQTNGRLDKNGKRISGASGSTPKGVATARLNECLEARALFKQLGGFNPDGRLSERRPRGIVMKGRRKVKA